MKKNRAILFTSIITFICGLLLYALQHEIIIIRMPHIYEKLCVKPTAQTIRKEIPVYTYGSSNWKVEHHTILWTTDDEINVQQIINAWLSIINDDSNQVKQIACQLCRFCPSKNRLYISFDRNPLPKESSTFHKWMLLEGLLKTLRETIDGIQNVQFLVRHQMLLDTHIDCSFAWPIEGFYSV